MTVYRDGWRLINKYNQWHIYDGQGTWRGRDKDRETAYNRMYSLMEQENTRGNHWGNIFGG